MNEELLDELGRIYFAKVYKSLEENTVPQLGRKPEN